MTQILVLIAAVIFTISAVGGSCSTAAWLAWLFACYVWATR